MSTITNTTATAPPNVVSVRPICGQAPSVYPEYAELLVRAGIDAISVSSAAVDRTRRLIAAAEQRLLLESRRSKSTKDPCG